MNKQQNIFQTELKATEGKFISEKQQVAVEHHHQSSVDAERIAQMKSPATAGSNAVKGAQAAGGELLTVKVTYKDGRTTFLKMNKTLLLKLKEVRCQLQGLTNKQCRFISDGVRIKNGDAPKTLKSTKGQSRRVWTSYGITNVLYPFILSKEVYDL